MLKEVSYDLCVDIFQNENIFEYIDSNLCQIF